MPDTKEGMFGIRVVRQLELASKGDITLYSADGHPTKVRGMSNEGISGDYRSSEGVTGLGVWGTRAKWMDLFGNIGDKKNLWLFVIIPKIHVTQPIGMLADTDYFQLTRLVGTISQKGKNN